MKLWRNGSINYLVCSRYLPENIFNMDETGLFYIKESTDGSRHYPNYKIEILQETVVVHDQRNGKKQRTLWV
jgi:hypothetical protein